MGIAATTLISIGHLDAIMPHRATISENFLRGTVLPGGDEPDDFASNWNLRRGDYYTDAFGLV